VPFRSEQDFSTVYTPGAGRVAQATAVLGLGDSGPRAGMPVLEGKAVLLETFALRSGVPMLLHTKDPERWCGHCAPHRTLDARVSHMNDAMKLAAAWREQALAGHVPAAPRRQEVQDAAR
jgi:malic enzyme-like protein